MIALYHMPNAICAQKVRVCLAEKDIAWESRLVTGPELRSAEYLQLNPGGYVPTLVHDTHVLCESRIISEYLNAACAGPDLMPTDPFARAKVGLWTKQVDDSLHLNVFILTCALILRHMYSAMPPQQLEIMLPLDIVKRERTQDILAKGMDSQYIGGALMRFSTLTADMEQALQRSPWLACDQYTLADADLTPYLQRLSNLGLSRLWDDKPALQDWWNRVRQRPSFAAVQADWFTAEETAIAKETAAKGTQEFCRLLGAA